MNRVVFDIETLAYPLDHFDEQQQEYLMKFATTDAERAETLQKFALYPTTAQIIAIGMLNPDSGQGKVLYQGSPSSSWFSGDNQVEFVPCDETAILEGFWKTVTHYSQFITFNGRSFDCPFIMLRSAMLGVKPSRNLLPYRFNANEHCDLLEQLTFYGAFRKFNLDFYCTSFGIHSPKSEGVTGLMVGDMFKEGKQKEIAEYCLGDVKATAELFKRWQEYLAF